jgi:hypothetical protein
MFYFSLLINFLNLSFSSSGCFFTQSKKHFGNFLLGIILSKRLLELPEKLDGFYLDHDSKRILRAETRVEDYRFGVANTLEQAKGMAAFCTLSQILPAFKSRRFL